MRPNPIFGFRATSGALVAAGAVFLVGSLPANGLRRSFDADHDGFLDREYYFPPQATPIRCGQTGVTLTGRTHAGLRLKGTDAIHTICH